jgi:predicted nucleotidyltransferase
MDILVENIVEKIVSLIHPTKIVLFGSRAQGNAKPDSDVDLLIIYDGNLSKREIKLQIHLLFPFRDFAMDVFVLSSREFEMQKNVIATVGRTAAKEGIVYYG